MKNKTIIILFIALLFGFFYRYYLASLAFNTIMFDMKEYSLYAQDFLAWRLPTACCMKNVGYGFILAIIFFFFGTENLTAVRIVNIFFDLAVAILVYGIARSMFGKKVAFLSYLFYIFNPFTSSYTGLMLPESVTILYVTLIAFIVSRQSFLTRRFLWFLFGTLLGILLFTRFQFYLIVFAMILIMGIFVFKKHITSFIFLSITGLILASLYSLFVYYKLFGVVSFVPPHLPSSQTLYLNYYNDRLPEVVYWGNVPEWHRVIQEYFNTPIAYRDQLSKEYMQLFLQKLPNEWPILVRNTLRNMFWLWDKDHLYTYRDPFYPADKWPLRIVNLSFIFFYLFGIVRYMMTKSFLGLHIPIVLLSLLLFLYMTFVFPLVSNESRYTIPFYSLIMLWAGYGLWQLKGGQA